jgi:t-SNARE complex subunit (syntaxin)
MDDTIELSWAEVEYEVLQVRNVVTKFSNMEEEERGALVKEVERAIKDANDAIKFFSLDLKVAELDGKQLAAYTKKLEQQQENLNQYIEDYNQLKDNNAPPNRTNSNMAKIPGAVKSKTSLGAAVSPEEEETKPKALKNVVTKEAQTVIEIHQETNRTLEQMIKTGEGTIQVGNETSQKLSAQTQELQNLDKDVENLGAEIKTGRTKLNRFYRALFIDHLVFTIIVTIIVLAFIAAAIIGIVLGVGFGLNWGRRPNTPAPVVTSSFFNS